MNTSDIEYRLYKTLVFEEQTVKDFLYIENTVFSIYLDRDYFSRKFEQNIYGPSIIVMAYVGNKPVAADALWRNDINGKCAYQSSDTAVMSECRGKGIFRQLVERKLLAVDENAIVYGFPNQNSFPGFLKMGWRNIGTYHTSLYKGYNNYTKINNQPIDNEYALWWFKGRKLYYSTKRGNHFFLIVKRNRLIYSIVGEISEKTAHEFDMVRHPLVLICKTEKDSFLSRNRVPMRIIVKGDIDFPIIPIWKMDAI